MSNVTPAFIPRFAWKLNGTSTENAKFAGERLKDLGLEDRG